MVKVKICGITRLEDAVFAVEQGADAIGTVLEPTSPRVFKGDATLFADELPLIPLVAVYGHPAWPGRGLGAYTHVQAIGFSDLAAPDLLKNEQVVADIRWIKVLAVKDSDTPDSLRTRAGKHKLVMLDKASPKHGGTGEPIDWRLAGEFVQSMPDAKVILAGGLNPTNVREAIQVVRPYAVDAASRLEKAPGEKDPELVKRFIQEAKSA